MKGLNLKPLPKTLFSIDLVSLLEQLQMKNCPQDLAPLKKAEQIVTGLLLVEQALHIGFGDIHKLHKLRRLFSSHFAISPLHHSNI